MAIVRRTDRRAHRPRRTPLRFAARRGVMKTVTVGPCTIYCGDCREALSLIEPGSVNTCVTSPPYFGLRSYMPDAVQLRPDLTPEERDYVREELAKHGIAPATDVV